MEKGEERSHAWVGEWGGGGAVQINACQWMAAANKNYCEFMYAWLRVRTSYSVYLQADNLQNNKRTWTAMSMWEAYRQVVFNAGERGRGVGALVIVLSVSKISVLYNSITQQGLIGCSTYKYIVHQLAALFPDHIMQYYPYSTVPLGI